MTKKTVRKIMLKKLKNQKEVLRLKKSRMIMHKLFALKRFRSAKTVMFYASFAGEVDTYKMIKEAIKKGKVVGLPFIAENKKRLIPRAIKGLCNSLQESRFGSPQPRLDCSRSIPKKDLDFVVVPGLAFDRSGLRLGRGQGYYDRFLKNLSKNTYTAGVCFDFQIVSSLPHTSCDLPVERVISA